MSRRFSDGQLYEARNHIPIRHVIETLLAIPSETIEGVFRFRCPLCAGRHTAVNPETNLSRCFHCGRNFNAIDLCMIVKHMPFVDSVKFLIDHRRRLPSSEIKPAVAKDVIAPDQKRAPQKKPVSVHEIFTGLMSNVLHEKSNTTKKEIPSPSLTQNDIAELERIAHDLTRILQRLKNSCHLK
jgi:DNA primase